MFDGLDQELNVFLALWRTAALATADADGAPHAANIQFVHTDGFELVWVSSRAARHSLDLVQRPACAMAIYAHNDNPEAIHGLQLTGTAGELRGDARARAVNQHGAKYTFVRETPALQAAVEKQGVYRFEARRVRFIDNRRGFGWKREWSLEGL